MGKLTEIAEQIGAGVNAIRETFLKGDIQKEGLKSVGDKHTPKWLRRLGCLPIAIPLVGACFELTHDLQTGQIEHIPIAIAAALGLLTAGIINFFKKH